MTKIRVSTFCNGHKALVDRRKIEDRHYFYGSEKNHVMLNKTLEECDVWTVILFGNGTHSKAYRDLPTLFRRLPCTWEQLFFVGTTEKVIIYRGSSLGSGYRFTHGIMANAFSLLSKDREVTSFIVSQGPRDGLGIHRSGTLRVYGHELYGNYDISRTEVDKNVPEAIRVYGIIR